MQRNPMHPPDSKASPETMRSLLKRSGIELSVRQIELLWAYHQILRQYNPELNLTRIHNFENMVLKLYADSILPGRLIELPSPLLDVGTGPGMPGIPLKIAFPRLQILLAESRGKRVEFLRTAVARLQLEGVEIVGRAVRPSFDQPVQAVITRAVETIAATLDRIAGCLAESGAAIFMKGPNCDEEIEEVQSGPMREKYRIVRDQLYSIPHTEHERRLVVFQRLDRPLWAVKAESMERHYTREIESEHNEIFKTLRKLLTSRGIRKQKKALVSGAKQVMEILRDFPERCEAWISREAASPPPSEAPGNVAWYQLSPPLFETLDVFGTGFPLLLITVPEMEGWAPESGLPEGCSVLVPFQDPENVGAIIRSAAAFGASQVILLKESANPYHPKAIRSSGGTVLRVRLLDGPALGSLPETLPVVPLSTEGKDIATTRFPQTFAFLPGMEGSGLPQSWRHHAVAIPIQPAVESLNAAVATAIALYVWASQRASTPSESE